MRLTEMMEILERNIPKLPTGPVKANAQNGGLYEYSLVHRQLIRSACEELSRIQYLQNESNAILSDDTITTMGAAIILVPVLQMQNTQNKITNLVNKASAAFSMIQQIIQESGRKLDETYSELEIKIELGLIKDIPELDRRIHNLSLALDKPARTIIGEGLLFGGLDIGSNWLIALATNPAVMSFAMTLVSISWYAFNRRHEHKLLKVRLAALSIADAQLEVIETQFQRTLTAEVDTLLANLESKHRKKKVVDQGDMQLLRGATDRLQLLFSQGIEIRNKLQFPPELKLDNIKVPELVKANAEAIKLLPPTSTTDALDSSEKTEAD